MVKYGHACEIFETTPTDHVAVQPFKVVLKLQKALVHASTVQKREAKLKFRQVLTFALPSH